MKKEIVDDYLKRNEDCEEFNKMSVYEEQIAPLKDEIAKICAINNIPFFFSCAPVNEKGKTTYVEDGHLTGSNSIKLYQDYYKKYILVRRLNLVPATRFTDFNEDTIGEEAMNYILNGVEVQGELDLE